MAYAELPRYQHQLKIYTPRLQSIFRSSAASLKACIVRRLEIRVTPAAALALEMTRDDPGILDVFRDPKTKMTLEKQLIEDVYLLLKMLMFQL